MNASEDDSGTFNKSLSETVDSTSEIGETANKRNKKAVDKNVKDSGNKSVI